MRRLRGSRREHRESKLRELDKLIGDAEFREAREQKEDERHLTSGVWGALHGKTVIQQMLTPWFILITLLTIIQMLRMTFFIATIKAQYEYMLGSEPAARRINNYFDIGLPVGGLIATPFIGLILDNLSTATVLSILTLLTTSAGILGSLPYTWAGYANVTLFVLLRPLYYSAMSDYATKVFGFATFGQIYGAIIFIGGVSNLVQPAIDAMNHEVFDNNPVPINAVLAALGFVVGAGLVGYVFVEGRRVMARHERDAAAEEEAMRYRRVPESIAEDESEADWA